MTKRPDVLVSRIRHLFDPTVAHAIQGVCATGNDDAWSWQMNGGPFTETWLLTAVIIPRMPGAYALTITVRGVSMWQQGHLHNNRKSAKILAKAIKNLKVAQVSPPTKQ